MTRDPHNAPPFNPDDLIHHRVVESHRVEFKATWGEAIRTAVVRTLCAFANDLLHLNGGYIVLGVEEEGGHPVLPPRGLDDFDLERLQKEIFGAAKLILPEYQPYVYPVEYQGRAILVLWAPGGPTRPYQAPEDANRPGGPRHHYIRQGPQTVKARGEFLNQLVALTAKVPFDDRRHLTAKVADISSTLVRRFLHEVSSDLVADETEINDRELYRSLQLVTRINAHEVPRNVALLFFNEHPERFFAESRIDVVLFPENEGAPGDVIDERIFRGPLPEQIRHALNYLEGMGSLLIRKVRGQIKAKHSVAYPLEAVEEAIINGVYHRSYEYPPEPLNVFIYPDRLEITSYPGPVASLEKEHFLPGAAVPFYTRRNRRIGDFLKELGLAETRITGLRKIHHAMRHNGSPDARFDFDEARTIFRVILPVHPEHLGSLRRTAGAETEHGRRLEPALRTIVGHDLTDRHRLSEQLGESGLAELSSRYDRINRELVRGHDGLECGRAEVFLVAFVLPSDAVVYALTLHERMADLAKAMQVEVSVRIGLDVGEVSLVENESSDIVLGAPPYRPSGPAVDLAGRLAQSAAGRQTLVSRAIYEMVRRMPALSSLPLRWRDLGASVPEGSEEPLEIFEIVDERLSPGS